MRSTEESAPGRSLALAIFKDQNQYFGGLITFSQDVLKGLICWSTNKGQKSSTRTHFF